MQIEEYASYQNLYVDEVPDALVEVLSNHPGLSFADVGCGDGALLFALKQRGLLANREVTAADLSETRLENTRKIDPNFRIFAVDAQDLRPIENESVAILCSAQVIEHVANDAAMLAACHRVLEPGGLVFLSTVFKKWYGWYFYRCNGRWVIDPTHLREYAEDNDLLSKIAEAGFQVLQTRKNPIAYPLVDFVVRRLRLPIDSLATRAMQALRRCKVPIPGYYNWELVLTKPPIGGQQPAMEN